MKRNDIDEFWDWLHDQIEYCNSRNRQAGFSYHDSQEITSLVVQHSAKHIAKKQGEGEEPNLPDRNPGVLNDMLRKRQIDFLRNVRSKRRDQRLEDPLDEPTLQDAGAVEFQYPADAFYHHNRIQLTLRALDSIDRQLGRTRISLTDVRRRIVIKVWKRYLRLGDDTLEPIDLVTADERRRFEGRGMTHDQFRKRFNAIQSDLRMRLRRYFRLE